jgi:bifunctional non-homologous end joining protein LigD
MIVDTMIACDGPTVFAHACKMGLEGIVSKRNDSAYRSGRSGMSVGSDMRGTDHFPPFLCLFGDKLAEVGR